VNNWITGELAPYAEKTEGVKLTWSPMNIDEILAKLENEKRAGADGTIDIVWINGENFRYAVEHGLLFEGFLDKIPNANKYLDLTDDNNIKDFAFPTKLSEAPWGRAQFVFAADTAKAASPPKSAAELKAFVQTNPGKFSYPESSDFTGSAFLRVIIYELIGYDNVKNLPADKDVIAGVIQPVFDYLNDIEKYLWREGKTYPKNLSQLDELFQDGTVAITMDYNPYRSYARVNDGLWPETTRAYVWKTGGPSNTHFLGIPFNSKNKEAAQRVINAALSPEMQASKARLTGWGDAPVLDFSRLSAGEKKLFEKNREELKPGPAASLPGEDELSSGALPELSGDVTVIIEKLWQERVLLQ
jgi:putative spermidine/putrescine transport system substrate-binding protein